jgi:glycogen operon protein
MRHPHVLQLMMDSLRYWVTEMHVDGFRFDLASTLARGLHDEDRLSAFFDLIQQDPIISQVKLVAEPWDVGSGGYQVGNFPPQWSEWNGKFRDTARDYWRGIDETLGDFAHRFAGSSDLYENTGRRPHASVNFVTAHDGFTLRDLVSYNEKHNEANQDNNTDGENHNRSWNCGAEGPTDDPAIHALRARQQRNFFATLLLSQGIPMINGGDEIGRAQGGNNNAYCQDNEMTWFDWETADEELLEFVRMLIRFRRDHPAFRRWKWFQGRPIWGGSISDIGWFKADGNGMSEEDWNTCCTQSLTVFLNGKEIAGLDARGERVIDDDFCILFNAHHEPMAFCIPEVVAKHGQPWVPVIDTSNTLTDGSQERAYKHGEAIPVEGRCVVVLCHSG